MLSAKNVYINDNLGVVSPSLEETLVAMSKIENSFTGNLDELIINLGLANKKDKGQYSK